MALPERVFLRHNDGEAIGPVARTALEVLFDARIVDERTPVSGDGMTFTALAEWPELMRQVLDVKEALGRGEDPWSTDSQPSTPSTPEATADIEPPNLIGSLVARAGAKATGSLVITTSEGHIEVDLKDGGVVGVDTTIPDLVLTEYLLDQGIVDADKLAVAAAHAPSVGGDLGTALVTQGIVEPHVYFEAFVGWARWALGRAAQLGFGAPIFEAHEVDNPSVPLGFDRLALPVEIVRDGFDIDDIKGHLNPQLRCPVILSQVEGIEPEDLKLQPKELRVLTRVNGVHTLQDLLKDLGGSEDKDHAVCRVVFFAEQAGFIVFGEDQSARKERAEASRLEKVFEKLSKQNDFEILGIDLKSTDEDVHNRFTELAKRYHPDGMPAAVPELRDVRDRIIKMVNGAYERQKSQDRRVRYSNELEQGAAAGPDEVFQVQATLQAETCFKKAEILVKVRKYDEALEQIDEAIQLNPSDTEFQIQRQYIKYLLAFKQGRGPEAAVTTIKEVLALLKNDANIASGYLVLGHLHKAVGEADLAHRYFEKVLEYDEDNVVATQEVRVGNLRKDREAKKKRRWI